MTDDNSASNPPKEPEWMTKLASLSNAATAKQQRERRLRGSSGAASVGQSLSAWGCVCGWAGASKDIKPDPKTWALTCPACGESSGLSAKSA